MLAIEPGIIPLVAIIVGAVIVAKLTTVCRGQDHGPSSGGLSRIIL